MGKVQFLFFRTFVSVLTKFSFFKEDWALGYNLCSFRDFTDISLFPKILSLIYQLVYTSLLLMIMVRFTCDGRKICSTITWSQNIINMMVGLLDHLQII